MGVTIKSDHGIDPVVTKENSVRISKKCQAGLKRLDLKARQGRRRRILEAKNSKITHNMKVDSLSDKRLRDLEDYYSSVVGLDVKTSVIMRRAIEHLWETLEAIHDSDIPRHQLEQDRIVGLSLDGYLTDEQGDQR